MRLLLTAGGLALVLLFSAWAGGEAVSSPHQQTAASPGGERPGQCAGAQVESCGFSPAQGQIGPPPMEWR
jgi:hypothetical protein